MEHDAARRARAAHCESSTKIAFIFLDNTLSLNKIGPHKQHNPQFTNQSETKINLTSNLIIGNIRWFIFRQGGAR